MSTRWGVYNLQGRLADGTIVDDRARSASRWFLRWRVDGSEHKRTFKQKGHAVTFRNELLRAQVMGWSADERGWPISPAAQYPSISGSASASPDAETMSALEPARTIAESSSRQTFESYCIENWYPTRSAGFGPKNRIGHRSNMRFAIHALRYGPGDPRTTLEGRAVGRSILLTDVTPDDVHAALALRSRTNARTAAANARKVQQAFARGAANVTTATEKSSATTVRAFYITLSMILNAASSSRLTTGDPLSGTASSAPKPRAARMSGRLVPSVDEVFDLADAIASLGPVSSDGRPAGQRFRSLVLCAGTLAPRPGELTAHMPDWIDWGSPVLVRFHNTEAPIYDTEEGLAGFFTHPLKHRVDGEWREVPALADVADALRAHLERGYSSVERTWTGPRGGKLNWGNLTETYWRPACEKVFAKTPKAALASMTPKMLRKAAITHWLDAGINPFLASEWAGHSEDVSRRYYAGRSNVSYAREVALLADASAQTARQSRD